ncbi:MAG: hypothetical protein ABI467_15380 [Kofleriaceae bacterium]
MYEDEVRRVQCVVCGEVHAYRKPRGDGTEGDSDGSGKKVSSKRLTWEDAMARATDADLTNTRPFSIRDTYEDGDVVHHPAFDIGFVIEQLPDNKVEVIFRDGGSRILVHNRGDLAARMPDIAEIPAPREAKKKKRAKKVETPATPIPARSKAEVEAAVDRARGAAQARMDDSAKTAEEHNTKLKAQAKTIKATAKSAKAGAKPVAVPVKAVAATAATADKGAKGAAKPAAAKPAAEKPATKAGKPAAKAEKPAKPAKPGKPAAKPAAKAAAKKPAKKPAAKPAKPAKKPAKPAPKKPAKPAPKKKK